jgi:flagellum-specific ATP synthase
MTLSERMPSVLEAARPRVTGKVARVLGLNLEVGGIEAAIGDAVIVEAPGQPDDSLLAEVVALRDDGAVCMPFGDLRGVRAGAPVEATGRPPTIRVGEGLLGRVVDGLGRPIDGGPPLRGVVEVTVEGTPPHPLRRARVERQLGLGVRALDTMVPCGAGQRLGIFAG